MSRGVKIALGAAIAGATLTAAHIGANIYAHYQADDAFTQDVGRVFTLEEQMEESRKDTTYFGAERYAAAQQRYNALMASPEVSGAVEEYKGYTGAWYYHNNQILSGLEGIMFGLSIVIGVNLVSELRVDKKRKRELEELKAGYAIKLKELKEGYAREQADMEARIHAIQGCAQ